MDVLYLLAAFVGFAASTLADTCNPIQTRCPPNVGLASSTYTIDFTKQTSVPSEWILSNYASINFGSKGAEFTIAKRFEAPQLWTNFYIFYGRVETVMQVAPGTGIISSAVLMSDDADEIDWEFSGNNFGDTASAGKGQNNYFGKGIVGNYDRGGGFDVASPQTQFHTYVLDWTPDTLTWSVDGKVIRTLLAANADQDTHQYPQTPSKFQLGMWAAGDPSVAWGTVNWAGGYTDFTKAPFTFYVESVKITNYNPAHAYNWTDKSGSSKSIQLLQQTAVSPSRTLSTSSTSRPSISSSSSTGTTAKASATCAPGPASAPTQDGIVSNCTQWHTAKPGDTCNKIADSYGIPVDVFMQWNPAVDPPLCYNMWLNYGYCVSIDCDHAVETTSSSSSSSSTVTVSSSPLSTPTINPTSKTSTSSGSSSSAPISSLISSVQPSTTTSTSASASNLCPDTDGKSLTSGNNNAYTIKCSSDSGQGSYSNTRAADSYRDCMDACDAEAATSGCKAWTYVGGSYGKGSGTCWLKTSSGTFLPASVNYISGTLSAKASSGPGMTQIPSTPSSSAISTLTGKTSSPATSSTLSKSSKSATGTPPSSASSDLCPEPSSISFVASKSGAIYLIRCSSDSNVGAYADSRVSSSYADCMDACDSDSRCQAFVYVGGDNGKGSGTCWFKDVRGSGVPAKSNFIFGAVAAKGPASSSITSSVPSSAILASSTPLPTTRISPTSSSTASSTSTASTTWVANPTGSNYTIYRSSDTNWGAYDNARATDSFLDCIEACDDEPSCRAWTYVGGKDGKGSGTCSLKTRLGQPVPASNNVLSGSRVTNNQKRKRAVSSWWNSVTATAKASATKTQRIATGKPNAPPTPPWARYYPQGGRWMWNGHGDWEWAWH